MACFQDLPLEGTLSIFWPVNLGSSNGDVIQRIFGYVEGDRKSLTLISHHTHVCGQTALYKEVTVHEINAEKLLHSCYTTPLHHANAPAYIAYITSVHLTSKHDAYLYIPAAGQAVLELLQSAPNLETIKISNLQSLSVITHGSTQQYLSALLNQRTFRNGLRVIIKSCYTLEMALHLQACTAITSLEVDDPLLHSPNDDLQLFGVIQPSSLEHFIVAIPRSTSVTRYDLPPFMGQTFPWDSLQTLTLQFKMLHVGNDAGREAEVNNYHAITRVLRRALRMGKRLSSLKVELHVARLCVSVQDGRTTRQTHAFRWIQNEQSPGNLTEVIGCDGSFYAFA